MRAADFVTATFLIALGALVVGDALRLGIGWGTDGPMSGFFPFWLAVILIVTALAIVVQAVRRADTKVFVSRKALGPVLKVTWPAAAMVFLTHFIGLYVATGLYTGFYMRWFGRHTWALVLLLGIGIPVVAFLIFEKWFLVPMPKGPLETWLGY
jgi:hypothetical protein